MTKPQYLCLQYFKTNSLKFEIKEELGDEIDIIELFLKRRALLESYNKTLAFIEEYYPHVKEIEIEKAWNPECCGLRHCANDCGQLRITVLDAYKTWKEGDNKAMRAILKDFTAFALKLQDLTGIEAARYFYIDNHTFKDGTEDE